VIVLSDVWKEFGFEAIVYLAALTAIDPTLYEVAELDGASRVREDALCLVARASRR
jgi:putative aldouronate transport system permease protein